MLFEMNMANPNPSVIGSGPSVDISFIAPYVASPPPLFPPRQPMWTPLTRVHLRRDRSAQKDAAKNVKHTAVYVPLRTALAHRWSSMTRRQTKELNPAVPFAVLGASQER